ncbi:alpha/beta hydrolase [Streptomyces sp. NBC_01341]|uniref:alpha/beta fold hydrolase n=1 Tax=Streptomyces sp. NBC_01341 TaxID=2903831 RepID=UPI002E15EE6A|nr:alpha/beta hydrolase [Streptomyces sp. NBC_01341]
MSTDAIPASPDPLSPGTHSFDVGGITQRYHVHGSGPVCVAHPGGPGMHWAYLRAPALERHLTMVYVEPIGTGASGRLPSHPHGYTRDRYSRFLELLINNLGVRRVHLLGHAHGALVAAHHAVHRPARLAGVVLHEGAPASASDAVRTTCVSGLDEDLTPDTTDDRVSLKGLTVPALVIVGSPDVSRGPGWGREVAEVIPDARLLVLEDSARVEHIGETASFTRAVRDFVQDAPTR